MFCKQSHLGWSLLPSRCWPSLQPQTTSKLSYCSFPQASLSTESDNLRQSYSSSNSSPSSTSSSSVPLSARERRKQRNQRREQLTAEKASWREELEENYSKRKTKAPPKGLKYELDMSRLTAKGMQWWMLIVSARSEMEVAESINRMLKEQFPDDNFEVFVPVVPTKRKMKDGSISRSTTRLHPGCVFLHAVMTRRLHDAIRRIPRCKGFFGRIVGYHQQVVMPSPVPPADMDGMFQKIREEEEDLKRLQEMAKEERRIKRAAEKAMKESNGNEESLAVAAVGSNVRITGGPYTNFEGCIVSVSDENEKVEVSINMFGEVQKVALDLDQIEIIPT